jgi:uncharacterized Tic20 family protein
MREIVDAVDSINADVLKKVFDIQRISHKYIEYVPLKDTQAGFSVKREYPEKIRYSPPRTSNGKADRVALLDVVCYIFKHRKEAKKTLKLPIFMSVHLFGRYFSNRNHFDYNFDDKDCPTKESLKKSKSTPRPFDLQSVDEYVYDLQSCTLQNKKGKVQTGEQLLDELFEKHCNTIHLLKGLKFRWRINARNLSMMILGFTERIFVWLLKICLGRELEPSSMTTRISGQYKKEDMRLLRTQSIEFLGYKASINVIITFSITVVAIIAVTHIFKVGLLSVILANKVGVICLAIIVLWLLDRIVPRIILWCINIANRLLLHHIFMEVKI